MFPSGTFEDTTALEKDFPHLKKYPVILFADGDIPTRARLLNRPEVESLLFLYKNTLHQLFLPKLVQEFYDEGECNEKVGGILSNKIKKYSVVSFEQNGILGNFWSYLSEEENTCFPRGKTIENEIFKIPAPSDTKDFVKLNKERTEVIN